MRSSLSWVALTKFETTGTQAFLRHSFAGQAQHRTRESPRRVWVLTWADKARARISRVRPRQRTRRIRARHRDPAFFGHAHVVGPWLARVDLAHPAVGAATTGLNGHVGLLLAAGLRDEHIVDLRASVAHSAENPQPISDHSDLRATPGSRRDQSAVAGSMGRVSRRSTRCSKTTRI